MAQEKKGSNPLVAGAVLAGVAVAAAVLSKKENRDKATKMVKDTVKKGEQYMKKSDSKSKVMEPVQNAFEDAKTKVDKNKGQAQQTGFDGKQTHRV